MRVLRAFAIALITGIAAAALVIPVSDYLTQFYHVSNMEGQRGMLILFGIAPLTFIGGFIIGLVTAIVFRRAVAGFIKAQGLSLAIVIALTGIVSFILYVAAEKPPTIDGKQIGLEFELRVPSHDSNHGRRPKLKRRQCGPRQPRSRTSYLLHRFAIAEEKWERNDSRRNNSNCVARCWSAAFYLNWKS